MEEELPQNDTYLEKKQTTLPQRDDETKVSNPVEIKKEVENPPFTRTSQEVKSIFTAHENGYYHYQTSIFGQDRIGKVEYSQNMHSTQERNSASTSHVQKFDQRMKVSTPQGLKSDQIKTNNHARTKKETKNPPAQRQGTDPTTNKNPVKIKKETENPPLTTGSQGERYRTDSIFTIKGKETGQTRKSNLITMTKDFETPLFAPTSQQARGTLTGQRHGIDQTTNLNQVRTMKGTKNPPCPEARQGPSNTFTAQGQGNDPTGVTGLVRTGSPKPQSMQGSSSTSTAQRQRFGQTKEQLTSQGQKLDHVRNRNQTGIKTDTGKPCTLTSQGGSSVPSAQEQGCDHTRKSNQIKIGKQTGHALFNTKHTKQVLYGQAAAKQVSKRKAADSDKTLASQGIAHNSQPYDSREKGQRTKNGDPEYGKKPRLEENPSKWALMKRQLNSIVETNSVETNSDQGPVDFDVFKLRFLLNTMMGGSADEDQKGKDFNEFVKTFLEHCSKKIKLSQVYDYIRCMAFLHNCEHERHRQGTPNEPAMFEKQVTILVATLSEIDRIDKVARLCEVFLSPQKGLNLIQWLDGFQVRKCTCCYHQTWPIKGALSKAVSASSWIEQLWGWWFQNFQFMRRH